MRVTTATLMIASAMLMFASRSQAQTVRLTPTPHGVTAEYLLDQPISRLTFADQGTVRTDWTAASPSLILDSAGVTSSTPIRRFMLNLQPDSTEDGRGYIALTRVGEGYVLYAPALASQGSKLSLKFRLPAGWIAQPRALANGYLYLGPRANVTAGYGIALHVAARGPANPLTAAALGAFDKALAFFGGYFGPPSRTPIMSVTQSGAGPMLFRGDVTDSGMISVRLHDADSAGADTSALVVRGAFHETAHLWNSHLARPAEGVPWFHEGGAEYLALVGLATTGGISQAGALAALSQRLSDCQTALGARPDALRRISDGPAVYDCGTVIQWFADLEMRRRGVTPAGIVTLWAELIARARMGQTQYGPSDFLTPLGSSSAAVLLLHGAPETRWASIDAALSAAGVRWRNSPSAQSLMVATLRHLNAQACPADAARGFSWRDGYVELGNDATCGPLAGDIAIGSIQGHDVLTDTAGMFKAVQDKCAGRQDVTVMRRGSNATIDVPCKINLATPIAYQLIDAPPLALPHTGLTIGTSGEATGHRHSQNSIAGGLRDRSAIRITRSVPRIESVRIMEVTGLSPQV